MSGAELMMAAAMVSAVGTLQQGTAARSDAEIDAQVRERDAATARDKAAQRARDARKAGSAKASAARARLGGSGVRLEGTPLDVLGQLAAEAELSAQQEIHSGNVSATTHLTRASASRRRGKAAHRQSLFNAGSTLLRGFS